MLKRLILIAAILAPALCWGQADPLNTAYQPHPTCSGCPSNVWITGPDAKVLQNTGSPGATQVVQAWYTQGEFFAFQIHYHDTGSGTANYAVTMSSLVQTSPSSSTIPNTYRSIIVSREAYMDVTKPSNTGSDTFYGVTGYYPDILIPAQDPYFNQTTNAFPFNVPAGDNQSVWVKGYIPCSAPSGYYSGDATLKTGSTTIATIPVVLGVIQYPGAGCMPATSSLASDYPVSYNSLCTQAYETATGAENGNCSTYPNSGGFADTGVTFTNIDASVMMLDHRISVGVGQNILPGSGSFSTFVTDIGPLLNGAATANTTTILPGAHLTSFEVTFSSTPSAPVWQNWATNFTSNGWFSRLYWQTCDEPNPPGGGQAWSTCAANAANAHTLSNPIIPNMVTSNIAAATTAGALNDVDTLTVDLPTLDPIGGSLQRSAYNTWLTGNCCTSPAGPTRAVQSYIACSSAGCGTQSANVPYPNYNVDGISTANRAMEWMTFLHQQSGELYYNIDLCFYNASCGVSGGTRDPWASVYYQGGWGDGTLVYPGGVTSGTDNYVGVTTAIWLPSLRLELILEGMQDYEILKEMTAVGQGTAVNAAISSWITNSYTFNVSEGSGSGTLIAANCSLLGLMQQQTYASVTPANCEASTGNVTPVGPATTMFAGARIGAAGHAGFK